MYVLNREYRSLLRGTTSRNAVKSRLALGVHRLCNTFLLQIFQTGILGMVVSTNLFVNLPSLKVQVIVCL